MDEVIEKWEYRLKAVCSFLSGVIADKLVEQDREITHVYTPEGNGKVTDVAKRPLSNETRRFRSTPA